MKMRSRILLRLDRQTIKIRVVGQSEALTEPAVLAVNLETRKVVGVGTEALAWKGMANFQLVWPFDHPRLIIWDWEAASFLLRVLVKRSIGAYPLLKPETLLQVTAPLEGGLGPIERRALLQALEAAGAGNSAVCEGDNELSEEMIEELLRSSQASNTANLLPYVP